MCSGATAASAPAQSAAAGFQMARPAATNTATKIVPQTAASDRSAASDSPNTSHMRWSTKYTGGLFSRSSTRVNSSAIAISNDTASSIHSS
jgi:hypothetical protein